MTNICETCGAQNSAGMKQCGSCGGPLREDNPGTDSPGPGQGPIESRWTAQPPIEDTAQPTLKTGPDEFGLASKILIASLLIFVLGFALQVYANEKSENVTDSLFSGDLGDMMTAMEDAQDAAEIAKWAGYLQTIGLIVLAAGLVGIAVGLSKRL
jgi:hypothetical protein